MDLIHQKPRGKSLIQWKFWHKRVRVTVQMELSCRDATLNSLTKDKLRWYEYETSKSLIKENIKVGFTRKIEKDSKEKEGTYDFESLNICLGMSDSGQTGECPIHTPRRRKGQKI